LGQRRTMSTSAFHNPLNDSDEEDEKKGEVTTSKSEGGETSKLVRSLTVHCTHS
jgi:hypothetical protein